MKKIRIKYEVERDGRMETTEVATTATSAVAAQAEFERKCKGKFTRVIGTQEIQ